MKGTTEPQPFQPQCVNTTCAFRCFTPSQTAYEKCTPFLTCSTGHVTDTAHIFSILALLKWRYTIFTQGPLGNNIVWYVLVAATKPLLFTKSYRIAQASLCSRKKIVVTLFTAFAILEVHTVLGREGTWHETLNSPQGPNVRYTPLSATRSAVPTSTHPVQQDQNTTSPSMKNAFLVHCGAQPLFVLRDFFWFHGLQKKIFAITNEKCLHK